MRLEARQGRGQIYFRAFVGLLLRDTRVLRRQVFAISARTLINPLLFVFVFTYLFPKIGQEVAAGPGPPLPTPLRPRRGGGGNPFPRNPPRRVSTGLSLGTPSRSVSRSLDALPRRRS